MNKRIWSMLLAACLLLTACAEKESEATEPEAAKLPVTSITTVHPDGSVEKMEQIFDENGMMIKANHYSGDKLVVSYKVTCDSEGRTLKMYDDAFGTGISMEYTYNADGKTEKIETKLNGETFFTQSYTYHESGEKASYTEEDARSASTVEYQYIYEEGVMRWEEYYENGLQLFSWEYTYDAQNRRAEGTKRDSNFMLDGSRKYTYEDTCTTVTTYDVEGNVRNTRIVLYDENGNVLRETFQEGEEITVTEYAYLQKN